jgi:hypothetical protein
MSLLSEEENEVFQQAIAIGEVKGVGLLKRALDYWWTLRCLKDHNKPVEVSLASSFGRSVHEMQEFEGMTKEDLTRLLEKRLELMTGQKL